MRVGNDITRHLARLPKYEAAIPAGSNVSFFEFSGKIKGISTKVKSLTSKKGFGKRDKSFFSGIGCTVNTN